MKPISNSTQLIELLDNFHTDKTYVFRGHSKQEYILTPSVFRKEKLIELSDKFPIKKSKTNEWFFNKEIQAHIYSIMPGFKYYDLMTIPHPIKIFFDLYLHIMQYNYSLSKYFEDNPKMLSQKTKDKLNIRDSHYWIQEDTFIHCIKSSFLYLISLYDKNGNLIKRAAPFEDLAYLNEFLPQHYSISTAALDWSRNPYVALYFALDFKHREKMDKKNKLLLSSYLPNENLCFSLLALKVASGAERSPIMIIDECEPNNIRQQRQEGVFTYFTRPCSYYLSNGKFPSIENYAYPIKNGKITTQFFEITKINVILKSQSELLLLHEYLEEEGITEEFLFPDKIQTIMI